jgi:hypothetical protein
MRLTARDLLAGTPCRWSKKRKKGYPPAALGVMWETNAPARQVLIKSL